MRVDPALFGCFLYQLLIVIVDIHEPGKLSPDFPAATPELSADGYDKILVHNNRLFLHTNIQSLPVSRLRYGLKKVLRFGLLSAYKNRPFLSIRYRSGEKP